LLALAVLPAKAATADAANKLPQWAGASFTVDAEGKTTSRTDSTGTASYQWDARGRLAQVTLPSKQTVSYTYDALGRRSSRSAGGVTTTFLYDGDDVVLDTGTDGSLVSHMSSWKSKSGMKGF